MPVIPADKAHELREYGQKTAYLLRDAAKHTTGLDRNELLALAARLHYCNTPKNSWLGSDIHSTETGELFEGFGRYWQCGSKLCSYCLRLNAKRNRVTLRNAVQNQKLRTGEHYRFITLTLPNIGLDIRTTRAIVNRAWTLLRKRQFFLRVVVGGAKAEEFTVTAKGFHYHLHLLTRSRTMRAQELRREWTECVKTAFRDHAQDFVAPTSDGLLFANIKIVHNLKQVTNEVCKYITKASSWWKMPTDALVEIALIPHWHRMFEVFGTFRKLDTEKLDKALRDPSDAFTRPRLFEDNDEGHEARNYWRILVKQMPLKRYLERLKAEVEATIRRRSEVLQIRFPFATITTLDDT